MNELKDKYLEQKDKILQQKERSAYLLGIGIVLLPLIYTSHFADPALLPRFLFFTLLLCVFYAINFKKVILEFIPFQLMLGALLLSLGISSIFAINPSETWMELGRMSFFVAALLAFHYVFSSLDKKHTSIYFIALCVLLSCSIIALLGLLNLFVYNNALAKEKGLYLISSVMAHKNLMASALFLGIPFALMLLLKKNCFYKIWSLLYILLAFVLIIVVQSRAVWLAIVGSGVILIAFLMLENGRRYKQKRNVLGFHFGWKKVVLGIVATGIIGIGTLFVLQKTYFSKLNQQNSLKDRLTSMVQFNSVKNEHTETINERLYLWRNSLELIKDHPILGVGAGNWRIAFPSKGMQGVRSELGIVNFQRPHNDYLWIWSEGGIIALLIWLGILGYSLFYIYVNLRFYQANPELRWINIFCLLGLIGYSIIAFFDFPKERCLHLLFYAILLSMPIAKKPTYNTVHILPIRHPFVMALPFFALGIFAFKSWGNYYYTQAMQARSSGQKPLMIQYLQTASNPLFNIDDLGIPLDWYIGEQKYLEKDYPNALKKFEQAQKDHPYQIAVMNNLGSTHFAMGNQDKAVELFKQALSIAPAYGEANLNLAAIYLRQKQPSI